MTGRVSVGRAARLLCAAAVLPLVPSSLAAQAPPPQQNPPPEPAELDPSAPMAPLPDLGVEWPDLNAREPGPQATVAPAVDEVRGDLRYVWAVEGISGVGNAEELLATFRKQSTLEAERKKTANAAQISRRAGADADLLTELLRSQGYYDAAVQPRTERVDGGLRVILAAEPGQQYRFVTVDLPGLAAAGEEAAKLRNAFGVKPGDPVIAADVIAAGAALTRARWASRRRSSRSSWPRASSSRSSSD